MAPESFEAGNRVAELALARLSGVSGLAPSVELVLKQVEVLGEAWA